MTLSIEDARALDALHKAFGECERPVHFTNFSHCEECAEHDQTLRSQTPESLTSSEVGNPGWDPFSFVHPQGFAYYLPALARLVLEEGAASDAYWYGHQFFTHLILDGPENERFKFCSSNQRRAVADFIAYLITSRSEQLEAAGASDDAVRAHGIWSRNGLA